MSQMISHDPISRTPTFNSQAFLETYPRSTAQIKPGIVERSFEARMMPRSKCYAMTLFVLVAMMFGITDSMRFEVDSGHGKCISEEIKANAMTVGKYSVVNPNEGQPLPDDYRITVKVTSPQGSNYHNGNHVSSGNFAFTASESGEYSTCFYVYDRKPPRSVLIEFDWRTGVAATDWGSVAKKGQLDAMQIELKKLYHTVISIHDEMFYLRESGYRGDLSCYFEHSHSVLFSVFGREQEMQKLNRSTNTTMITFGYLSLLICLSVAGLQFWHLKTYFERKKLL